MRQHLVDLLDVWQADYQDDWVVAILTHVQGSSYRKPGAIMFFHPLGKTLGMLSGGCLEADLRRHAQRAIQTQQVLQLTYDATDESDTSYQLGCGGIVNIMMLPINSANQYLGLQKLYFDLNSGKTGEFQIDIAEQNTPSSKVRGKWQIKPKEQLVEKTTFISSVKESESVTPDETQTHPIEGQLIIPITPPIHLGIFGGGLDAQPIAQMAATLGWQVTIFDERTAYARQYDFPTANIMKMPFDGVNGDVYQTLDAAFVMTHNLTLDAKVLNQLVKFTLGYVALLGPGHRRDKVFALAQLNINDFSGYFSAPAGLALGGELPSSVGLSMLAQCHGVLHSSQLISLDKVMR